MNKVKPTTPPTWEVLNSDEVIDTRNIVQRMEDMRNEHVNNDGDAIALVDWPADAQAEYTTLSTLIREVESGCPVDSPEHGVTLIRDTWFTEYVKHEYAELHCGDGLYAVPEGHYYSPPKPVTWDRLVRMLPQLEFVDWQAVADHDRKWYAEVTYHGATYLLKTQG